MGFHKVKESLAEYLNANAFCRSVIKFIDIIAAVVTVLYLLASFVDMGGFINGLLPYAAAATVVFALAAKGKLGLLIITAGKTLVGFIGLVQGMVGVGYIRYFSWASLFAILFWGALTFLVVVAINKEGLGNSMLADAIQASSQKKGPARICTSCGSPETNADAAFCRTCGAKLPEIPAAPAPAQPGEENNSAPAAPTASPSAAPSPEANKNKACPKCGKAADDDTVFCTVCGTKLK